jgi:hypothetical protein
MITADSIEEKLINLQTFKKYIANNVVDSNNICDKNLNVESFMESLEEFGSKYKSKNNTPQTKKEYIEGIVSKQGQEEVELEYLKKLYNEN